MPLPLPYCTATLNAMRYLLLLFFLYASLLSCRKEDLQQRVKLSTNCKRCAVEYYDGHGALHRDTMYGTLEYTWVGGNAIVDTVPDWTAGWHILLREDEEPRISACALDQVSTAIIVKAEGDRPTRTVTTYAGCANMP